jgi:hypothetical protein
MVFFQFYLWIAPHLILCLCLAGMLQRKLYKQFPLFFSYISFQTVSFVLLFSVYILILTGKASLATFQWMVVGETGVNGVLQLAVLYETSGSLAIPRSSVAQALRTILRWAAALLVLTATVISAAFSHYGIQRVLSAFQDLNFFSAVISLGLLITLIVFARFLNVVWRSLSMGIVLGFGILSSAELGATPLMSILGRHGIFSMDLVRMAAFHVCVLVWLVYVFRRDRPPRLTGEGLQQSDLEFWDQELQRIVQR